MSSFLLSELMDLFRCPETGEPLRLVGSELKTIDGSCVYPISEDGLPLFASSFISPEALSQQTLYDGISLEYIENLSLPHTQAYNEYLDDALFKAVGDDSLGVMAEICCGRGEAVHLLEGRYATALGIDVSVAMLRAAANSNAGRPAVFIQGDATRLPLANNSIDNVIMLGGIHHVPDRLALFGEIERVLKPGGRFIWREPVSDFAPWRWLRAVIYRLSPALDHETERPLEWKDTVPVLEKVGLRLESWNTFGFLAYCLLMNSDVLKFNKLFRYLPGIIPLTRAATRFDHFCVSLAPLRFAGLQVIGTARKSRPV